MNEKKYLVSILVPVYRVEKYIERCAKSLLEQTYDNIEYIFVDDCSPDRSISILKQIVNSYPQRSPFVQIIKHEKNKGLAAARNTAISTAKGLFVMHVDSDDYLDKNAVEYAVKRQVEVNADIVSFNCYNLYGYKNVGVSQPDYLHKDDWLLAILASKCIVTIWGRLIRKSLYDNNNLTVEEGVNVGEDFQILPRLVYFANKVAFVNLNLYFYDRTNENSYISSFSENRYNQVCRTISILQDFFVKIDMKYVEALKTTILMNEIRAIIACIRYPGLKKLLVRILKTSNSFTYKDLQKIPLRFKFVWYIRHLPFLLKGYVKISDILKNK